MTPMTGTAALNAYFLDARARLLDLAAILDRIDRGGGAEDERLVLLQKGVEQLNQPGDRAERIQTLFSLAYDPKWERPMPRG